MQKPLDNKRLCEALHMKTCDRNSAYDKLKMNNFRHNPFGFCNHLKGIRASCELPHTGCNILPWGRARNGASTRVRYAKISTLGQCLCLPGYSYQYDPEKRHHCEKTPTGDSRVRRLLSDTRRWVEVRKLELGGFVRDLLISANMAARASMTAPPER
mmetsp:Transcript_28605/g.50793  ORF Transcript_28605/g.50793 Transcript_28605/m.50793 type:complete len:157 (-) Transcript_28605:121-591(-)